jgi:gas vesicle protein
LKAAALPERNTLQPLRIFSRSTREGMMIKFLLGISIGAAIGLVIAPASGEETRRQLLEKADDLKRQGVEAGRRQAREVGSDVGERLFDKAVGER